ncbi:Ground-like domain protein [Aphelenchoides besseyi]|nr:Ground-like domain protein [Aphelenchoides besseyi]
MFRALTFLFCFLVVEAVQVLEQESNSTVDGATNLPFNFVVSRKGDKPLTTAKRIDRIDEFLLRRKRILEARRRLFIRGITNFGGLPSRRLQYLRKPDLPFLREKTFDKVIEKTIRNKFAPDHQVYFVSLPIIMPPNDPFEFHGPPQTCVKNFEGLLCCNSTLKNIMLSTYEDIRNRPNFSITNVHRIANEVQKATEKRFGVRFEVVATATDFVSKTNFNGDLNCKIRIDGKFILAYATPTWPRKNDIELIDASGLLSSDGPVPEKRMSIAAEKLEHIRERLMQSTLVSTSDGQTVREVTEHKPIFLVYGPIR